MNAERRTYKSVRVPAIRELPRFAGYRCLFALSVDIATLVFPTMELWHPGLSCLSSPVWTYNKTVIRVMHGWCHAVNFQVGSMHFPVIQRIITVDFSRAISMFTRRRFSLRSKLFPPPLRSPVRRRVPTAACALVASGRCADAVRRIRLATSQQLEPRLRLALKKFLHDSCRACWSSLCQVPGHISVIH